jgi:gluconate 2-dehydrogenase gamma chain
MDASTDKGEGGERRLSRGGLLKRAGVLGVGATAVGVLASPAPAEVERVVLIEREALESFTAEQMATVDAIVARLIPSDANDGGAAEARVGRYIDRQLNGGLASYKPDYANGLAQVDAYAKKTYGAAFVGLSAVQQDAVLTNMEANTATGFSPSPRTFFNIIRDHAVQGMFSDPFHGGNANFVGWDLIGYPGVKIGAVLPSEQAIGTTLKPAHRSSYSYDMFLKTTKKETRLRALGQTSNKVSKKGGDDGH